MTWWDTANDPNVSTGRRAAAAVGCGLLPWVCLAQEGAEAAQESGEEVGAEIRETRETVAGEVGEGGIFGDVGAAFREAGEGAARPIEAYANVLKWGAVALGVVLLTLILGLVVWYVILPYARGGPQGAS